MVGQPIGHQVFKNKGLVEYVNAHIESMLDPRGFSSKGDCESQSLTLCRYLSFTDKPTFVAQLEGMHTVVYFDYKYWIDPGVGLIWNKSRSKYFKLSNFSQESFNYYYGPSGLVKMTDDIIFLQINEIARSLNDLEKL